MMNVKININFRMTNVKLTLTLNAKLFDNRHSKWHVTVRAVYDLFSACFPRPVESEKTIFTLPEETEVDIQPTSVWLFPYCLDTVKS